ncbi:hypothetical protein LINGRAHAP2_LOCUS5251 [Linum grandiflorum]
MSLAMRIIQCYVTVGCEHPVVYHTLPRIPIVSSLVARTTNRRMPRDADTSNGTM